ncbi:hypothetical protein A4X13_0g3812 [Tilletia indica]|uniref:ATP-dependent DNA helicase n=1 Tax=Tilletia indica TaxID=43049 RepID=A0A177TFV8_9BASI|nr:hypothetical protein A4X13_0g3812 [Tilletia indica]
MSPAPSLINVNMPAVNDVFASVSSTELKNILQSHHPRCGATTKRREQLVDLLVGFMLEEEQTLLSRATRRQRPTDGVQQHLPTVHRTMKERYSKVFSQYICSQARQQHGSLPPCAPTTFQAAAAAATSSPIHPPPDDREEDAGPSQSWPQPVPQDVKDQCMQDFVDHTDISMDATCAVCARRTFSKDLLFTKVDLRCERYIASTLQLDILRVSDPHLLSLPRESFQYGDPALDGLALDSGGIHFTPSGTTLDVCTECHTDLVKDTPTLPALALANGNIRGKLPPHLQDCTWLEERLCARYLASAYIIRLFDWTAPCAEAERPRVMKGHACAFPLNTVSTATKLPWAVGEDGALLSCIVIGPRKPRLQDLKNVFRVRRQKVQDLFNYLKAHCKDYPQFAVNEAALNSLPVDDVPELIMRHVVYEENHQVLSLFDHETSGLENHPGILADAEEDDDNGRTFLEHHGVIDVNGVRIPEHARTASALRNATGQERPDLVVRHGSSFIQDYNNPDLFPGMFPTLYPWGTGGFEGTRATPLSFERHSKYLLDLADPAFRRHWSFIFIVANIKQRRAIHQGARLACKQQDHERFSRILTSLDATVVKRIADHIARGGTLKTLVGVEAQVFQLLNKCNIVSAKVPGSRAVMNRARSDIRAMIGHFGIFQLFLTINPSATHSPVFHIFYGDRSVKLDTSRPVLPSAKDRAVRVADDPVAGSDYFHFHLAALFRFLLGWDMRKGRSTATGGLLGRMAGYYLVKEHTMRGQLHCHCLIWLEGALNPGPLREKMQDDEEFRTRYFAYFDDIITHGFSEQERGPPIVETSTSGLASTPTQPAEEGIPVTTSPADKEGGDSFGSEPATSVLAPDPAVSPNRKPRQERPPAPDAPGYRERFEEDHVLLAKEVQLHKHTFTCFKGGRDSCRFFFPHEVQELSSFDPETKSINLAVKHPLINWHNRSLLVATRHNHDLKAVQSGKSGAAAASYITSYTTKSDETPANQVSMINTVYQRMAEHMDPTTDPHGLLTRCVMQFGRERQLHAQQAATYVRELGDTHQSHGTAPMLSGQVIAAALRLNGPVRDTSSLGPPETVLVEDVTQSDIPQDLPTDQQTDPLQSLLVDEAEDADLELQDGAEGHIRLLNTSGLAYQVDDYLLRPDSLSFLSFYDFVRYVKLWDKPPKKPNSSHHPLPTSHPNAKTHVHRYTPNKPIGIPRPICSHFPKSTGQPGHGDAYCSAMMAHFIPFSQSQPLKSATTTWESAFAAATFSPSAVRVMSNWAALAECEDERDADRLLQRRRESERARRTDDALNTLHGEGVTAEGDGDTIDLEQFLRGANAQSRETVEFSRILQSSGWFGGDVQPQPPATMDSFPTFDPAARRLWLKEQSVLEAQAKANIAVPTAATGVLAQQLSFAAAQDTMQDTVLVNSSTPFIPALPTQHYEWNDQAPERLLAALVVERTLTPSQALAFTIAGRQFFDDMHGKHHSESLARHLGSPLTWLFLIGTETKPLRMLMHGEAGTGKTVVVRLLRELMDRYGRGQQIMFVAPTGKAASAIGGMTQHAAFKLDIRQKGLTVEELEAEKQDTIANRHRYLQKSFGQIRWIFFDEVSMTSCEVFNDIDQSLRIGTSRLDEPFGGINVLFAGDFCQLPPVGATPLYASAPSPYQNSEYQTKDALGRLSWLHVDTVVEFEEQKRMQDPEMAAALSRLRRRACVDDDVTLFNGNVLVTTPGNLPIDLQTRPGVIVLANTNQTVRALNHRKAAAQAASDGRRIVISHAADTCSTALTPQLRKTLLEYSSAGKVKVGIGRLPLFVGMPVIYRGPNKSVQMGITNGAFGTVVSWQMTVDSLGFTIPQVVVVRFDTSAKWKLSNLEPGCLPIYPTRSSFKYYPSDNKRVVLKVSRSQLPLQPGFAMTVHSAQGVTSSEGVVVDLRGGGFRTYVAASRATRRQDIYLVQEINKSHLNCPPLPKCLALELHRLERLAAVTKRKFDDIADGSTSRNRPTQAVVGHLAGEKRRRIT